MMLKVKDGSEVVVWVIDPFEGKLKPHPFEVKNLLDWVNETGSIVRPVYILNLSVSHSTDIEQNDMTVQKTAAVQKAMKSYLHDIGCPDSFTPKILVTYDMPVGGMVERLLHYCEEVGTEMIVVSSRGRKGFDRFVFGSFAEALLFQSRRPLYFLTHENGGPIGGRHNVVLFPTDFSKHSELAFEELLKHVAPIKSEVILYHSVSLPPSVVSVPENYYSIQERDMKARAVDWGKKGESSGVHVTFVIRNLGISVCAAPPIIEFALQIYPRFIAMASNSGGMGSTFFGSVAREVFRTNLFPVWICGPQTLKN